MNILKNIFSQNKQSVTTNIYDFRERLGLHDHVKADDKAHMMVLVALMKYKRQTIENKGRGHSFYTDPDQTVINKPNVPQSQERPIQSSANVSYTEDRLENGQWSFAMTINQSSATYEDMRNRMIFGLYGIFDRQTGDMAVDTILAPDMDSDGNITGMINIPLSPYDLELATLYAENCTKSIFNGYSPDAKQCLDDAIATIANAQGNDHTPLP